MAVSGVAIRDFLSLSSDAGNGGEGRPLDPPRCDMSLFRSLFSGDMIFDVLWRELLVGLGKASLVLPPGDQ